MDIYATIAIEIISRQELIIGPVAVEQAKQVDGIQVDWPKRYVKINGNGQAVVDALVAKYRDLFGQISVEVCREAAAKIVRDLTAEQLPKSLQ